MTSAEARKRPGPLDEEAAIAEAARLMTRLLRGGLVVALVLLSAGVLLLVFEAPGASEARVRAARTLFGYLGLQGIVGGFGQGSPESYLALGILVLVLIPVLRVVTGAYFFRIARDRPMAAITATVLALLLLSLFVLGPLLR